MRQCAGGFGQRPPVILSCASWNLNGLPVPADLLVYTLAEWDRLMAGKSHLAGTLRREAIWVFP